jgi:pyruvate dehydrogenase phosphatase
MGWESHLPEGKSWPYTIISEELLDSEYKRLAKIATHVGGRADSVTFQPFDPSKNQDRLCVQEWDLKDGTWIFAAVFDGNESVLGTF